MFLPVLVVPVGAGGRKDHRQNQIDLELLSVRREKRSLMKSD
jgi:hypothetical protein